MSELKKVLMERDGMTAEEADKEIARAKNALTARLEDGDMPFDFMEEEYGLEPDYLEDLIL
jgi:hypothetical protein